MVMPAVPIPIQIARTSPGAWQIVVPDTDEHRDYALKVIQILEGNTVAMAEFYGVHPPNPVEEEEDEDYED